MMQLAKKKTRCGAVDIIYHRGGGSGAFTFVVVGYVENDGVMQLQLFANCVFIYINNDHYHDDHKKYITRLDFDDE